MNKLWPGATTRQREMLKRQYGFDRRVSDEEVIDTIRQVPVHAARNEDPPFGRGETFYGLSPAIAIDPNNLGGKQHEGKTWVFEDLIWNNPVGQTGARKARTNRYCTCMIVRNVATFAILPKRLVTLKKAMANYEFFGQVDGYAAVNADQGFPVDEWLPAVGVPINDLFWVVIEGPATVQTGLNGDATNTITQFSRVCSLTAATSGASSAGRVYQQDLSGATSVLGNQIQNSLGYACTGMTTGQTGADILVDVRVWI
jgi:hypothetical protein